RDDAFTGPARGFAGPRVDDDFALRLRRDLREADAFRDHIGQGDHTIAAETVVEGAVGVQARKEEPRGNLRCPGGGLTQDQDDAGGRAFHRGERICLRRPIASSTFSRELKALTRKYPSPLMPKPLPGVTTMWAWVSRRSKASQLERLRGVLTQTYGAWTPPYVFKP